MRIARWSLFVLSVLALTACPKKGGYLRAEVRSASQAVHPMGK